MNLINRRSFLLSSGLLVGGVASGFRFPASKETDEELKSLQSTVKFIRDGIDMSPLEYSWELYQMAQKNKIQLDYYSNGGSVEELEEKFASLLGKESAIFMPTGTLAIQNAEQLVSLLNKNPNFQFEHILHGTNVFNLYLKGADPEKFRSELLINNIVLPAPTGNKFSMKLNVTINRKTPEWIANKFEEGLSY